MISPFYGSKSGKWGLFALCSVLFILSASSARAQQPFVTDDADVTEKGKFHLEVADEIDRLQLTSLPDTYQNGTRAIVAYGLAKDLEVSVGGQFLSLVSVDDPRFVYGVGDTTIGFKYDPRKEKKGSKLPALAISAFLQLPTGNASRSLGSGVTGYGFNAIAQKTLRKKNTLRVNLGYVAAGNTLRGVLGISSVHGEIFTSSSSFVRKINDKWQLGGEIAGAVTSNFQLSKGQFQTQFGGNYQISKKLTFDFGLIAGRFAASPRCGLQFGFSRDF